MEDLGNSALRGWQDEIDRERELSVLVVGKRGVDPEHLGAMILGQRMQEGWPVHHVGLADLDAGLLSRLAPEVVVSPLVDGSIDCVDVAFRLASLGFLGSYRVVAEHLPHPAIVRREVESLCPGLDFDIIDLGRAGLVH